LWRWRNMIPRQFEYHSPSTVEEAIEELTKYGGEAKLLAGGQSLIPLMKLRLVSPGHLVDLNRIKGLDYVREEKDGFLAIGALTRMADIEESGLVRRLCPILSDCAAHIADPLVRNLGTIGGNVCHADPTNDMPAVMVATGAELVAAGKSGRRTIRASEFFLDTFTTALREDEVLVELKVPYGTGVGGAYVKLERQAGDFAIVGAAVSVTMKSGRCEACGIGLTAVGPTVVKPREAERELIGSRLERAAVKRAAEKASKECQPASDLRGSADYKREMVKVMVERAAGLAAKRAGEGR
jgi:carbon-monoxide dehydrogenase medium subunit